MKIVIRPKKLLAAVSLMALAALAHVEDVFAEEAAGFQIDASPLPHATTDGKVQAVLTIVFALIGIMALLSIVIGGFKYITSQGDSQAVAKAKSTIIYSIVGLIISIFAVAIVTFVIGAV